MKGFIFNPDKEYVSKIIDGIYRKNGHCPCRVQVDDTTICPCDDFVQNGVCKCNLFVAVNKMEYKNNSKATD